MRTAVVVAILVAGAGAVLAAKWANRNIPWGTTFAGRRWGNT